jgi:hypothetical protein
MISAEDLLGRADSQHVFVTEEERWGSSHGEPFTSRSDHHVSMYRRSSL